MKRDQREALQTNPIADAIAEAQGQTDELGEIVFELDGYKCVRVGALVNWVNKNRADSITLPGGRNAIIKVLEQEYGAESVQVDYYNDRTGSESRPRVLRWPIRVE